MNQDGRPVDRKRLDTSSRECSTSSAPFVPSFRERRSTDPVDVALPAKHQNGYVKNAVTINILCIFFANNTTFCLHLRPCIFICNQNEKNIRFTEVIRI